MVFMRKWMVESPFQAVLRCFENVLRRNVPTLGSKEPDVGTFLYNTRNLTSPPQAHSKNGMFLVWA